MDMKRLIVTVLVVIAMGLLSCGDSGGVSIAVGEGTVTYMDIEGGCWLIVTDGGREFNPGALPAEYRVDGMRVHFEFIILSDVAGVCMRGDYVSISSIEAI